MMYGHDFFGVNGKSTITLKDGRTYPKEFKEMSTTDALQIQWRYCRNRLVFSIKNDILAAQILINRIYDE